MNISQLNGNPFADAAFRKYIETEGAVIFSFNDEFSPANLWGGSWEKIIDRVLVGAGGDYALESSGGNLLHNHGEALSIATDQAAVKVKTAQIGAYVSWGFTGTDFKYGQDNVSINGAYQLVTDDASLMPPYVSCNIWRKVA
nr:MAG TPA: baseplate protein [Caudoviricetes sp.]